MTRVLVIEDAGEIRALITHVLNAEGIEVEEAPGGFSGLQALAERPPPDVVLLDLQMPDVDGWDTLAIVRSQAATENVPVIICSVKSNPADVLRAWELGCDAYLTKPFSIADLVDQVRTLSGMSQAELRAGRRAALAMARLMAGA